MTTKNHLLHFYIFTGLIFSQLLIQPVFGEGTKQLEPTNPATTANRRTRIMFDQSGGSAHRTPFAVMNCAEKYRLNVYISDPATEQIYMGFNDGANTLYYQIKDPDGDVVTGFNLAAVPSSSSGFISTWEQAYAGPKIGTVNPTGYDPKILTPTKSGNYYIEFAKTLTGGSFTGQDMLYFDVSVVDGTTVKNGRLWSKAWQLSDDASGDLVKSYPAKFYVYSDDGIVTQLNINEWNGGTYTIYCNQWGVSNTNNWAVDRISDDSWPGSDLPQYKIFLNNPDVNAFPTGEFGHICEVSSAAHCNGSVDLLVKVNKPGSVTLNLDIAPLGPGTEDVTLTGNVNGSVDCNVWDTITWNGLDGNGNPVQSGTPVTIGMDYLNGLTNLPLWDVEDNASGLIVNIVRPAPTFSTKLPIYWDDSQLPGGSVNAVNGCIYPTSVTVSGCHSWTSQNENMINTWWYYSEGTNDLVISVIRNPAVDFSFANNCSGNATQFTDLTDIPGGYATSWHWDFGVFGDTSNIQNPVFTYNNGGNFNVLLKVTSNNGCTGTKVKPVVIYNSPVANAGNDKTIPYATSTTLQGTASGGSGNYSYHWEPVDQLVDPNVQNPATVQLSQTTDFTLIATDQGNACPDEDVMTVTIFGGPLGVQLFANPEAICFGSTTILNAQVGGGSGTYTFSWTSDPPGFTSSIEDVTVQPSVTTTYSLEINDGFSLITNTITVIVYPSPVVSAGNSQTIPNGTSTTLTGSTSVGIPPYSYSWTPANLVVNPTSYTTATNILTSTTNFTLHVIDGHGCGASADVLVSITGGPLAAHPYAVSSPICLGETTVLHPLGEGGSGNYSYKWSTNDGFQSTESDPVVAPTSTTTYHLVIQDGFTQSEGEVKVVVNPLPSINLIPSGSHLFNTDTILACVFDTLILSASAPNLSYLWSNGSTAPSIEVATTGIAFDILSYGVQVVNSLTGCSNTANLTIIFTYSECSYSVQENEGYISPILVFPNPGKGVYQCRIDAPWKELSYEVLDQQGRVIQSEKLTCDENGSPGFTIDISACPAGIYLLMIQEGNHGRACRLVKY